MEEQIVQALFNCTQTSIDVRQAGEAYLSSLQTENGFGVLLVKISLNSAYPIEIRQLSVIVLKNQCKKWKDSVLNPSDKEIIKSNILQCLKFSVPEQIRVQFEEIAYVIGRSEKSCDGLIIQIHEFLDSNDSDLIYAGLNFINQYSRQYEFVISEKRSALKNFMSHFFGKLEILFERILSENSVSVYNYLCLILQTYWVNFYIELPPEQANEDKLDSWLNKFRRVLLIEFDLNTTKSHYEQETLAKEPKLQCKKWVSQILYRFFNRYHDFRAQLDTNAVIGQIFTSKWQNPLLDIIISQTFEFPQKFIPDIIMNYYLKYINQAIKDPVTLERLKAIQLANGELLIPSLIRDIITPVLCKTPYDEELWNDNPIEYIHKQSDLSQVYYSSSCAAVDILESICDRGYLPQFLNYLHTSLTNSIPILTKEALLFEVGSISESLSKNEALAKQVQQMLELHVFPEFANPIGFLRARACWVYGQFSSFPIDNIEHQKKVLENLCALVIDPQIPVKYEAALALPKVLNWEISKSRAKGEIVNVLKIYLDLINEIDSEEIIEALEDIVTSYSDEVLPFAIELSSQLTSTFLRLVAQEHLHEEDQNAMAAVSVLYTINKIIETTNDNIENIEKISVILIPVFEFTLAKDGAAYMTEGLNLLASILYYIKLPISGLEKYFSIVLGSLSGEIPYGVEKYEEIFPVLANYISKYSVVISNDLENIVKFLLNLIGNDINLTILACKLLICMMEHFKTNLSAHIPLILSKAYEIINISQSPKQKTICCQLVYVSLWADTLTTLSYLDSNQIFKNLFNYSLNNFKYIREQISRKQVAAGISSFLPFISQFPDALSIDNAKMIFIKLAEIVFILEDDKEEGNDESPFVDSEEFNKNSKDIIERIRHNFEDDEDEDDILYETDADEFYDSVFEDFHHKNYLRESLAKTSADIVAELMKAIDEDAQKHLARLLSI